jgi:hypothetical protein
VLGGHISIASTRSPYLWRSDKGKIEVAKAHRAEHRREEDVMNWIQMGVQIAQLVVAAEKEEIKPVMNALLVMRNW